MCDIVKLRKKNSIIFYTSKKRLYIREDESKMREKGSRVGRPS